MKPIKSILISMFVSIMFLNIAMADSYIPVIKVVNKKIYLTLDNVSDATSVQLMDGNGLTIMEEETNTRGLETIINLESVPSGSYTLVIKSNAQETLQPITVTSKELIVDGSKSASYFPANLTKKKSKLKVSLLNPTNSAVRVFVLDQKGRMIYEDAIENQLVIDKEYNLKQFPAGKYMIMVDNAKHIYSKYVNVN